MTDYIKRIQSRLSRKGIKFDKLKLREEIAKSGYSIQSLNDELVNAITDNFLDKYLVNNSAIDVKTGNETVLEEVAMEPENISNQIKAEPENISNQIKTEPENISNQIKAEPENISNQINKNISNSIIISPEEKCAAIASQSTSLNVQLSENETLEIYSKIPDYFADYESFTDSVITSLKDFIDNKFNHQESNNTIEELRRHIASRQAKLDQKLASGISSIGEDFEHYRSNIKSSQARILALFKTST
jgi:polyhydroxyalkanoate synthesis regulator phasin